MTIVMIVLIGITFLRKLMMVRYLPVSSPCAAPNWLRKPDNPVEQISAVANISRLEGLLGRPLPMCYAIETRTLAIVWLIDDNLQSGGRGRTRVYNAYPSSMRRTTPSIVSINPPYLTPFPSIMPSMAKNTIIHSKSS